MGFLTDGARRALGTGKCLRCQTPSVALVQPMVLPKQTNGYCERCWAEIDAIQALIK